MKYVCVRWCVCTCVWWCVKCEVVCVCVCVCVSVCVSQVYMYMCGWRVWWSVCVCDENGSGCAQQRGG